MQWPTIYNLEANGPDPGSQQSRMLQKDFSDASRLQFCNNSMFQIGAGTEANLQTLIATEGSEWARKEKIS